MKVLHSGFFFKDRKYIPRATQNIYFEINPREFSEFLADFLIFADVLEKFSLIQNLMFFACNFFLFFIYHKYISTNIQNHFFPIQLSEFFPGKLDYY